jgi:hypothetical protein
MYHPMSYRLAQARIADLRRYAQCDTIARAAHGPAGHRRPGLRPWVRRSRAVPGTPQAAQVAAAGDAAGR